MHVPMHDPVFAARPAIIDHEHQTTKFDDHTHFAYDNLDRLRSATLNGVATTYSYDATGNRTSKVITATTYANTISATSNRITQTQDVGGTATVTTDAAGV